MVDVYAAFTFDAAEGTPFSCAIKALYYAGFRLFLTLQHEPSWMGPNLAYEQQCTNITCAAQVIYTAVHTSCDTT